MQTQRKAAVPAAKRPWSAPAVEQISPTEALTRLLKSKQPMRQTLAQVELLARRHGSAAH